MTIVDQQQPRVIVPPNESDPMEQNQDYRQMGILVSPTFKIDGGSETAKSLGHNEVLTAPQRGLKVSMLESFGQRSSQMMSQDNKSNTSDQVV